MSCQKERALPPTSHKLLLVAGVAAAWFAQSAIAGCPPGYLSKAGHCIPGPAQPHHPPAIESTQHAPVAVSPGKVALNPQPIPPGHTLRKLSPPPPHTPVDQTLHWDLKKNNGS